MDRYLKILPLVQHVIANLYFARDPFWIVHADDYCARTESPYESVIDAEFEKLGSPSSVHIVFRHGARGQHKQAPCFAHDAQVVYSCSEKTTFNVLASDGQPSSPDIVKVFHGNQQSCSQGQLLDIGEGQARRLGRALVEAYPVFNETMLPRINLYSTDTQRTMATLRMVLTTIFPNITSPFRVNTREFIEDFFALNIPSCNSFVSLRSTFEQSAVYQQTVASKRYRDCAELWEQKYGTELNLKHADDCLLSAYCADVRLPGNMTIDPTTFGCVMDVSFFLRRRKLGGVPSSAYFHSGQQICQIGAFKVFEEFNRSIRNGDVGGLYAIHDETFVCLLTSLGIWDERWPKYGEYIAFEKFPDNSVRVLRNGRAVALLSTGWEIPLIKSDEDWKKMCSV